MCFFFKQKTAYEMRISDWSSDVCSSDLPATVTSQVLVARPTLKAAGIKELLASAKGPSAEPISYGSVGIGSLYHVTGTVLAAETGSNMFHVPYQIGRASCRERVCQYV